MCFKCTNGSKAILVWAVLDPANPFVSPQTAPFIIGLGIGVIVWGYASATVEINTARDLGPRLVAMIFFGRGQYFPHA
jgi:glycerol uptake facilitator-like aquaporin